MSIVMYIGRSVFDKRTWCWIAVAIACLPGGCRARSSRANVVAAVEVKSLTPSAVEPHGEAVAVWHSSSDGAYQILSTTEETEEGPARLLIRGSLSAGEQISVLQAGLLFPGRNVIHFVVLPLDGAPARASVTLYRGIDSDGDGASAEQGDCDDGDASALALRRVYRDADTDGYGDVAVDLCFGAVLPTGYLLEPTPADCDDAASNTHPGACEILGNDGRDDNCDGSDRNLSQADQDGDGAAFDVDCNDCAASVHPRAASAELLELCGDEIDQDCDGTDIPCPQEDMVAFSESTFDMGCKSTSLTCNAPCEGIGHTCDANAVRRDDMGNVLNYGLRRVTLSPFRLDRLEVSRGAYRLCLDAGECPAIAIDYAQPLLPMAAISWTDAERYCRWRGARLPTEAEWERAARGTTMDSRGAPREYPWEPTYTGSSLDWPTCAHGQVASCGGQPFTTTPVGSDAHAQGASPEDVRDLCGNVSEWVADWYDVNAYGGAFVVTDPAGPSMGTEKVSRGGDLFGNHCFNSSRFPRDPSATLDEVGVRCAMSGP